jgi:hypothetical protein
MQEKVSEALPLEAEAMVWWRGGVLEARAGIDYVVPIHPVERLSQNLTHPLTFDNAIICR